MTDFILWKKVMLYDIMMPCAYKISLFSLLWLSEAINFGNIKTQELRFPSCLCS